MDIQPSSVYHSSWVRRFNEAHPDLAAIQLREEFLLAEARRETGLQRFGDESFLAGLQALLESLEAQAALNAFGRFTAQTRTIRSLKNRLWANACFEAHPEIRQRKIGAPIIIVGPHRSGTTRLHRMLATDTRLQYLKTWEGMNPAPRTSWPEMGRAARYEEALTMLRGVREVCPDAFTAHPMDADWAEEEMLLLNHSFCSFSALGLYGVPSYYQWFLHADKTAAYRDMADLMRLISWSRGDSEGRPWILKNPQHMLDLDVLIKIFPDAKLIFTHRDPQKTVASAMSLMWFFAVQNTDFPCRAWIRDIWLDFCEQMARRCMLVRETIPASQQVDVHFDEVNRDWRSVMRRIYSFNELEFSPPVENAMREWLATSKSENHHGRHRYSLEDFGVSREEVDVRFRFVRDRYAIPYEGS